MAILTGVPRATVTARQANRRVRLLLAAAIAGPLLGILALAVAAGRGHAVSAPAGRGPDRDRAFAEVAALDVLAGRPTDLPRAGGLGPDLGWQGRPIRARSVVWSAATEATEGGERLETDTFTVEAASGLYHLSVEVADTPAGPVIGSSPALTAAPLAPSGEAVPDDGSLGAAPAVLDGGALRQIQAWAHAYVDGDPATVYRLTGDTRSVSYPVLEGWTLDRATVTATAVRGNAALVGVELTMHHDGVSAGSGSGSGSGSGEVTSDLDVLLGHLDQSLPFVEAWGPAGSGPDLLPHANALP